MTVRFDQEFWDDRYRQHDHLWSGDPNPHLLTETADLPPGAALDLGCGEGADAVWLARRGWRVDALDISQVALRRASEHAAQSDPLVAERIVFGRVDLMSDTDLGIERYDLISMQYMHFPRDTRERVVRSLATATKFGGTLLVVAHHRSDVEVISRPHPAELFHTGADLRALLEPDEWQVVTDVTAPRTVSHPETGDEVTIHDAVFRARRIRRHAGDGALA